MELQFQPLMALSQLILVTLYLLHAVWLGTESLVYNKHSREAATYLSLAIIFMCELPCSLHRSLNSTAEQMQLMLIYQWSVRAGVLG